MSYLETYQNFNTGKLQFSSDARNGTGDWGETDDYYPASIHYSITNFPPNVTLVFPWGSPPIPLEAKIDKLITLVERLLANEQESLAHPIGQKNLEAIESHGK
jgi:hypothetical protein